METTGTATQNDTWTYAWLKANAVSPGSTGAYRDQPSDPKLGLHVHSYDPDEIHVIYDGTKLAEVHPQLTEILVTDTILSYGRYDSVRAARDRLPQPWHPAA